MGLERRERHIAEPIDHVSDLATASLSEKLLRSQVQPVLVGAFSWRERRNPFSASRFIVLITVV
jgi:hypothetical protein